MNSTFVLKIFNEIAFITSIFNMILSFNANDSIHGIIYVWVSIIATLCYTVKSRNKKVSYMLWVLLFLPVIWFNSGKEVLLLIILSVSAIYIVYRTRIDYSYFKVEFERFMKVIGAVLVLAFISDNFKFFQKFSMPYIVIYMVSAIILLRNLRYEKYIKTRNERIKRMNTAGSATIVALSVVLSIENVRDYILHILTSAYNITVNIIFKLFGWLFIAIGYVLMNGIEWLYNIMNKYYQKGDSIKAGDVTKKLSLENLKGKIRNPDFQNYWLFKLFMNILDIFIIVLILYLIFRVIKKYSSNKSRDEVYEESKEYILRDKNKSKGILKNINEIFRPKDNNEKIRLTYKRFMQLCMDRKIEIEKTDSTQDINNKSDKLFSNISLTKIRDVYIKIRYGSIQGDETSVREIRNAYQELKDSK